jgi:hypothetical protein
MTIAAGQTRNGLAAPPKETVMAGREEDVALIRRWFQRLTDHVQAVDYVGARQLFAEGLIAFGTFADFVTGRDAIEQQQWRNIWGSIDDFRCRLDGMHTIISADRRSAVGMVGFNSTGRGFPRAVAERVRAPGWLYPRGRTWGGDACGSACSRQCSGRPRRIRRPF